MNLLKHDIIDIGHWLAAKVQASAEPLSVHVLENGNIATRVARREHRYTSTWLGTYDKDINPLYLVEDLRHWKERMEDEQRNPAKDDEKTA